MKFTEEIYSQISFMDIIVIIVKNRRDHVINIFGGYAYSKLFEIILTSADRFFSSARNSAIFVTCNKH